jgi:hypothetical protein
VRLTTRVGPWEGPPDRGRVPEGASEFEYGHVLSHMIEIGGAGISALCMPMTVLYRIRGVILYGGNSRRPARGGHRVAADQAGRTSPCQSRHTDVGHGSGHID